MKYLRFRVTRSDRFWKLGAIFEGTTRTKESLSRGGTDNRYADTNWECHYPKLRTDALTYIQKLGGAETLARYSFFRDGLLFANK